MPLFSVIIPIYKVEKYLCKCIDSVTIQNFKDIEIILVDDGSPDNCPQMCDEYAKNDSRIKVIHKENGGSSDARNMGITAAKGDYLMFLDSDDYWEGCDFLSNITKKLSENQYDVLLFCCKDYNCITRETIISRAHYDSDILEKKTKNELLNYLFKSELFPGSAWITVTRREFIVNNNIFFIKDLIAEDFDWLLNVFYNAKTFTSVNDAFYIYLKHRNGSITTTAEIKSIEGLIFTVEKWAAILENAENTLLKEGILGYLVYVLTTALVIIPKISGENSEKAKKIFKKNIYLYKYANITKTKIIRFALKVLGLNITAKLSGIYYTKIAPKRNGFISLTVKKQMMYR